MSRARRHRDPSRGRTWHERHRAHWEQHYLHAMSPFAWYLRRSLRRRIFFLLGGAMLTTGVLVLTLLHFTTAERGTGHIRLWPLLLFGALLWGASGRIAHRLARPYAELARVAGEIGAGKLSARFELRGGGGMDEARMLADAINDMARRIEKQMADQRELLAAVSHEIRTPLARIRLLAELLRGETTDKGVSVAKALDDLDREVIEIDALVSELLASSRLDFAALRVHKLDATDVAARALERAGLDPSLLKVETKTTAFVADATLVARALANLLANAKAHGAGVETLRVRNGAGDIVFEVEDRGLGFEPGEEEKVFESFYQRPGDEAREKGSLGLGLTLVKRIAVAHGGTAFASNRAPHGARVGITLPRTPPS